MFHGKKNRIGLFLATLLVAVTFVLGGTSGAQASQSQPNISHIDQSPHGQPTEIGCQPSKLAQTAGLDGQYLRIFAGPRLEPNTKNFMMVLGYRPRFIDQNGQTGYGNYQYIAVRENLDCSKLVYESSISWVLSDTVSAMEFFYPGNGSIYAFFGINTRNGDGTYSPNILDVYFGEVTQS